MLEEHQILLNLQEVDMEVCETIMVEEVEHGLHSSDGWDLSTELDQARALEDGIIDERATKAMQLSQHIVGISNALADVGMLFV
jgi:hypothetical protein